MKRNRPNDRPGRSSKSEEKPQSKSQNDRRPFEFKDRSGKVHSIGGRTSAPARDESDESLKEEEFKKRRPPSFNYPGEKPQGDFRSDFKKRLGIKDKIKSPE